MHFPLVFQPHIFTGPTANNLASTDTGFVTRKPREYNIICYFRIFRFVFIYVYIKCLRVPTSKIITDRYRSNNGRFICNRHFYYVYIYVFSPFAGTTLWNGTETNTWPSPFPRVWRCTTSSGFTFGAKTSRWVYIRAYIG